MRSLGGVALGLLALVVIGSLAGFGQVVGVVVLPIALVAVLLYAVGVVTPGVSSGHVRRARGLPQLGRYGDPSDGALFAAVLGGLAAVEAGGALVGAAPVLGAVLVVLGLLYCVPVVGRDVVGASGIVALLASLSGAGHTPIVLSDTARAVLFGSVVVVGVAAVLVREGSSVLGRVLGRRRGVRGWALVAFGVADLLVFVVAPEGLDIWAEAGRTEVVVLLALVLVVAVAGVFAPRLVLGSAAIGAAAGEVYLMAVGSSLGDGPDSLRSSTRLVYAGAFAVVVFIVSGFTDRS